MKKLVFVLLISCSMVVYAEDSLLKVTNAFARASLPGQVNSVAFLDLENTGAETMKLKKAYSEKVEKVELHEHLMEGGKMMMRQITEFELKPGEKAEFKPGAKHIMLLGLENPLKEGDSLEVKLCFDQVCQKVLLPVVSVLSE